MDRYISTRGEAGPVSAAEAILKGIAPDGGLFVPSHLPRVDYMPLLNREYGERAGAILPTFLGRPGKEQEAQICSWIDAAYSPARFDSRAVVPLKKLERDLYLLELWHGPTGAFKDIALQLLPYLLTGAVKQEENRGTAPTMAILVATSGDTGKAALEGFCNVPGTRIIVFYPEQGVSEIQKRQMVTQQGPNVAVVGVRGNFDDAQTGVKKIFTDQSTIEVLSRRGYRFSSANSINWGRLAPQIVYYFSAYLDLIRREEIKEGEKINFVVPTGNFGNILAGFYAGRAGLPVNRLICASNTNHVLTDFIQSGTYDRNRPFLRTISPSMDILISSNLERLLFEVSGRQSNRVKQWMEQLAAEGRYHVNRTTFEQIAALFWSGYSTEQETMEAISQVYHRYRYVIDPHTAVAVTVHRKYRQATGDPTKTVILSTASPFKFNASVARALLGEKAATNRSEFELLATLSAHTGWKIPAGLSGLEEKPVRHTTVIDKTEMKKTVLNLLQ